MDLEKLRVWWWRRQGLDGSLQGKSAAEILEATGWARSVGGAGPYLTLFARGGLGRQAVDQAVSELSIQELPSARGCTYVLPAAHFALGLQVGQGFNDEPDVKTAKKLGVSDAEIGKLCDATLAALASGPLDPDGLRDATGDACRSLGEEGRKKGLSTTLPVALGILQSAGEIRRVPLDGRLDRQRYQYRLWRPNPMEGRGLPQPEAFTELARRYFEWTGPATLGEFQWFSGLGVKAAKAAVEPLGLEAVAGNRWVFPKDRRELESLKLPQTPRYSLVSSLDALFLLRRDVKGLICEADLKRSVPLARGSQQLGALSDLSSHAILDRGRLIGLWEYDPEEESIAWSSFGVRDAALQKEVARTEAFIREDLGDARSFSLDSPKSRRPRIEALRKLGAAES